MREPTGASFFARRVARTEPHRPTSGVSTPMSRTLPRVVTTVSPSTRRTTLAVVAASAGEAATTTARGTPVATAATTAVITRLYMELRQIRGTRQARPDGRSLARRPERPDMTATWVRSGSHSLVRAHRASRRNRSRIGPAVCEPDSPTSTNTATARSPWVAIIQVCVGSGSPLPNSAVPVLAPIGGPGTVGQERRAALGDHRPHQVAQRRRLAAGQRLLGRRLGRVGVRQQPGHDGLALHHRGGHGRPSPSARPAPCPGRSATPPSRSPRPGAGTEPKYAGKPRSWSSPRPSAAAARVRSASPSFSCWEISAVLQEFATAVRSGMSPSAAGRVVVVVLEALAVHGQRRRCRAPGRSASPRPASAPAR